MKKYSLSVFIVCMIVMLFAQSIFAHSGRTDSSGGHNCSAKSVSKGLCTGYHYHNGGSSTKSSTTEKSESKSTSTTTVVKKKETYSISRVELYVNSEKVMLKNDVLIKDNSNYFPIREVANAIGAAIDFNSTTNQITISKNNLKTSIDAQGKSIINENSTTYAAIRAIVSDLNIEIEFDATLNRINLKF